VLFYNYWRDTDGAEGAPLYALRRMQPARVARG